MFEQKICSSKKWICSSKNKKSSENVFPCTYILGFKSGIIFKEKNFFARAKLRFLLEQKPLLEHARVKSLKFNFFDLF